MLADSIAPGSIIAPVENASGCPVIVSDEPCRVTHRARRVSQRARIPCNFLYDADPEQRRRDGHDNQP